MRTLDKKTTYKEFLKIKYSNIINDNQGISYIDTNNLIENNLIKRASYTIIKETITEIYEDDKGKIKKSIKEIKKEIPPDTQAIIFYLKNNSEKYKY
ncbi:hypothetical protein R4M06_06320 [Brachyspira pilosicoli]|uniref:hypothetical protein n=1 Tax=Brachyspira pilosicoli TaxID=52584 RepID=UPI0030064DF0